MSLLATLLGGLVSGTHVLRVDEQTRFGYEIRKVCSTRLRCDIHVLRVGE